MPPYSYKKTDGDFYEEEEQETQYVLGGLDWKFWFPLVFIILSLIALIVMVAVVLDNNVSKVSNQDLKEEIQDRCGPPKDILHSSKDCDHFFKEYMDVRFHWLLNRIKHHEDSKEDWDSYWKGCSEPLRHAFDERMDYVGQLFGPAQINPDVWPGNDMWDVKDLKDYMSTKFDWLAGRIKLVSVNKNTNDNDVDIVIQNTNDIDIDIKSALNSATEQMIVRMEELRSLLVELGDRMGLDEQEKVQADAALRALIQQNFQDMEGLLTQEGPV